MIHGSHYVEWFKVAVAATATQTKLNNSGTWQHHYICE